MKVSHYRCDFNTNLKEHDAVLHLIIDGADPTAKVDLDACAKHALSMIGSSFLNRDSAKTITVTKINGSSTKVDVKPVSSEGVTYAKKPCPAGCEREFAPQGLRAHLQKFHPDYKPEE